MIFLGMWVDSRIHKRLTKEGQMYKQRLYNIYDCQGFPMYSRDYQYEHLNNGIVVYESEVKHFLYFI